MSGAKKDAASGGGAAGGSYEVRLRVYDLSGGMARQMSMAILGKQVDGIWHTGIQVHGREYFFGGGIQALPPRVVEASFGIRPVQELVLGHTSIEEPMLMEYLRGINGRFTQATYNLFTNNCNHFSHEVSQFLIGKGIPEHIVNLPNEVLATPLGRMLEPMITQMQNNMYGAAGQAGPSDPFSALAAARGSAPAPAAVAAPVPAPAPAPAPAPTASVAAVPASAILSSYTRPLVSADNSILKVVLDRLLARGALKSEEEGVARAAAARLVAGKSGDTGAGAGASCDGKAEEGDGAAFIPILRRIMVATDKTAGPALCLLRSALLDDGFLADLLAEPSALSTVIVSLAGEKYTTVTPRLMALAAIANLVAAESGASFLAARKDLLSAAIDAGLHALSSDSRPQLRQLGAAVLHNLALRLPAVADGRLSDDLSLVLCSLCEAIADDGDAETTRRRLLAVGLILKRGTTHAGEIMAAAELLTSIRELTTDARHSEAARALGAEIVELATEYGGAEEE